MPVLILDSGETLIESAAILDYLDEIAGPSAALIPRKGPERRKAMQILVCATAACDKAIAINYERRRPAGHDWIERCRAQLDAALAELESFRLELSDHRKLQQAEITTACAYAYVRRIEPEAARAMRYPSLERLSAACEMRQEFLACLSSLPAQSMPAAEHRVIHAMSEGLILQRLLTPELVPNDVIHTAFAALAGERLLRHPTATDPHFPEG
jgi:glutathione S-transferase